MLGEVGLLYYRCLLENVVPPGWTGEGEQEKDLVFAVFIRVLCRNNICSITEISMWFSKKTIITRWWKSVRCKIGIQT